MGWLESTYSDTTSLARFVAQSLAEVCRDSVAARARAVLALAGGRTPFPAYRQLASMDLPWSKIDLIATDERCVPHDHPACNGRELREAFGAASGVTIHMLTPADGDAAVSQTYARQVLSQFPNAFDAVVLGIGADAHTASLFPKAATLSKALADEADSAYRIDPHPLPPEAPFPRVSMSRTRLCRSRVMHLLLTGEGKRAVLHAARSNPDPQLKPISAFFDAPMHVHWSP